MLWYFLGMPRPIHVDPHRGAVTVIGAMLEPGTAPMKIDVWRHVRHPPPDLVHVFSIATAQQLGTSFDAGHPASLMGKVLSWVWVCRDLPATSERWRVRIDIRQEGISVPDYPAEYWGPLPLGQPLAQLKISEVVHEHTKQGPS